MTAQSPSVGCYDTMSDADLLETAHIYGLNPAISVVIAERLDAKTCPIYNSLSRSGGRLHFQFKNEGAQA